MSWPCPKRFLYRCLLKVPVVGALLAVSLMCSSPAQAIDIFATGVDQAGGQNWNQATWNAGAGQWSDGLAPSGGKTYSTAGLLMRTTQGANSTFGGDSLRIATGGRLFLKQGYSRTATVDLILDGGALVAGDGTGGTGQLRVSGDIQVASNSIFRIDGSNRRRIALRNGTLSGSGNISINGGTDNNDIVFLESTLVGSHTGNWTINNGGRLIVSRDDQIGNLARVNINAGGARLEMRSNQVIGSLQGNGWVQGDGSSRTLTVGDNNVNTTFSGRIVNNGGTVSLTKRGNGRLILSGGNSNFTGNVNIQDGILRLQHSNALGGTGKTVTVAGGGNTPVLELQNNISVTIATLRTSGSGISSNGALRNISGNNTITANSIQLIGGNGNSNWQSDSGLLTINGNITNNAGSTARTLILDGAGNGLITGDISNGDNAGEITSLTKGGTGTWTLSGNSTYTGTTTINNGTLVLAGKYSAGTINVNGGVLAVQSSSGDGINPSTKIINVNAGGTLRHDNSNRIQNAVRVNVDGVYNLNNRSDVIGSINGSGSITLGTAILTLDDMDGGDFSGVISGTGRLTLRGNISAGVQTLSGANTYSGNTTISKGTLALSGNGSINNTPQISIASGAFYDVSGLNSTYHLLGGQTMINNGTIVGNVITDAGSTISPGLSVGLLTYTGDLDIDGNLEIEVDPAGPGSIDMINVLGVLDVSDALLNFNFVSLPLDDAAYVFAKYGSLIGAFAPGSVNFVPVGYELQYAFQGNQIALVFVPEPATMGLLSLAAMGLARRRRRWAF